MGAVCYTPVMSAASMPRFYARAARALTCLVYMSVHIRFVSVVVVPLCPSSASLLYECLSSAHAYTDKVMECTRPQTFRHVATHPYTSACTSARTAKCTHVYIHVHVHRCARRSCSGRHVHSHACIHVHRHVYRRAYRHEQGAEQVGTKCPTESSSHVGYCMISLS